MTYFENHLAEDVVWMDEDGHAISGKSTVVGFIRTQLTASPARTLTASNVRVGSTADAAWATFAYTIEGGDEPIEGLNTTVFRRAGNEWEVVVVHGAMNAAGHH
jgi:ketosteroid isomerase-like protein